MNILFLHNKITQSCGITRIMSNIAGDKSYWKNDNFFLIVGLDELKNKKYYLPFKKIKIFHSNLIFDIIYIIHFCIKNNIQVITSFHRYYDLIAKIISKIIGLKTITVVQSKVYGKEFLSYRAELLIAVSFSIKKHLINEFHIKNKQIKVIPNFIDTRNYKISKKKNEILQKLNIKTTKIVGYIGRINIAEKGIDILLQAFKKTKKNNVTLILVGRGTDEKYVKEFIKLNKLKVILLNETEKVCNYYNLFDVFILPSRVEPFGIVLLEAGFMKVPVIASRVDGIPEIIKNEYNGLLFEPDSVDELADKIKFSLEYPEKMKELSENLYDEVINHYTSEIVLPKYKNLYNDLIKE
jgi:glycosyltransferase involved in cell wall biosynthesis